MPRYDVTSNAFVEGESVEIAASAARTAGAVTKTLDTVAVDSLILELAITAIGGTGPLLDVVVETKQKTDTVWRAASGSPFPQKTAVGNERRSFPGLDEDTRVTATVSGGAGATFTYSLSGESK